MNRTSSLKAYIYVGLSALLWASIGAVGKILLQNLDNIQVLFFASLFGFIGLFLIVLIKKKLPIIKTYSWKDYAILAGMSFLGVFLYSFFLFGALDLLPAQEAFLINYLWPIIVVIFAIIILKEKLTIQKAISIACSFLGVLIIVTKGQFE